MNPSGAVLIVDDELRSRHSLQHVLSEEFDVLCPERAGGRSIQCLILAKAYSIGLRSGEQGGRSQSLAPVAWIAPDSCGLVAAEIVHDDNVASLENRRELLFDISAKAFAVDRSVLR
jgi:hypothetical protein